MFHAGSSGVDYLNAAIGLGGLLGAFAATTLSAKRLALTFGAAILLWGAPIAVLAPLSLFGLAILCLAAVGAANAFEDVALITLLQRSTPDGLLASVLGVLWGLAMTAVAVGSIVAPWVVASVGDRTSLVVVGLVLPVLALVFGRRLADIDKTVQPREGLKLIDGVPMYAPLSLAIKERVAASLLRVPVRAGETVVQAGGPGHRFYIVGAGQLRIGRAGVHLLDVGPGDYFGEIALLKDVPRTASVTAVVDSVLYALGRDAFLVAVTGHAASVVLARQVVTERQPEDGGQPLQTGDPASVRRGRTVWCRWSTTETIEGGPREGHAAGLGGKSVLEAAVSLGSQPPAVTFEHPYQLPELQWRDAVRDGGQRLASRRRLGRSVLRRLDGGPPRVLTGSGGTPDGSPETRPKLRARRLRQQSRRSRTSAGSVPGDLGWSRFLYARPGEHHPAAGRDLAPPVSKHGAGEQDTMTPVTKEETMILGTQYYRPPFPERRYWHDDLAAMVDAGLDTVQLWACWGWIEAGPGKYRFDDYDDLVSMAGSVGLQVVISTVAEIQPFWIPRLLPGSEMVDHFGRAVRSSLRQECNVGLTPGGCFDHPGVRDKLGAFLEEIGRRYRGAEALFAWDCWNETRWAVQADAYVCYCHHTVAAYREWLRGRYGDLEGLGAAWHRRYDSWDDVVPGKSPGRPYTDLVEFEAFLTWRSARHAAFRAGRLRDADGSHLVLAHCGKPAVFSSGSEFEQAVSRGNDFDLAEVLDGFGCSHFPAWEHYSVTELGSRIEEICSAVGSKPAWVSELQGGGARSGLGVWPAVDPGAQQRWVWGAYGRGIKAVLFWCWRDEVFGRESSGFGLMGSDGQSAGRLELMAQTGRVLKQNDALFDGYRPDPPEVGVLFSQGSYQLDWRRTATRRRKRAGACSAG